MSDSLGSAPIGPPIDVQTCDVYETANDLVVTSWVYGDLLGQRIAQITADAGDVT